MKNKLPPVGALTDESVRQKKLRFDNISGDAFSGAVGHQICARGKINKGQDSDDHEYRLRSSPSHGQHSVLSLLLFFFFSFFMACICALIILQRRHGKEVAIAKNHLRGAIRKLWADCSAGRRTKAPSERTCTENKLRFLSHTCLRNRYPECLLCWSSLWISELSLQTQDNYFLGVKTTLGGLGRHFSNGKKTSAKFTIFSCRKCP